MAGLMLECVLCSSRKWLDLSLKQAEEVSASGATLVTCEMCKRDTYWKFAESGRRSGFDRRMDSEDARKAAVPGARPMERLDSRLVPEKEMPDRTAVKVFEEDRRSTPDRRGVSQRQNYRLPLQLPIRVRSNNLVRTFEEITTTINVCRNGVYFASRNPHSKGAVVRITMNYNPTDSQSNIEQLGTVVRVDTPVQPSEPRGVAVQFS